MNSIVLGVIIITIIICLVALFCAILIKLYITKIKKYNAIIYQKEIAQQQAINQAIIETQQTTLENLSKELHDDAGQQLTFLNFQLENLKLTHHQIEHDINPLSISVNQISNTLRDLSHSLSQQKLQNNSLEDSIKQEIERLNKLNAIKCHFSMSKKFNYKFSENEKIILFRVFQEVTNNMLKHSKATQFDVTLSSNPCILLVFKDNGIGFSSENSKLIASNGIENIKSRAELINFSCKIDSKPNQGTTINLSKL